MSKDQETPAPIRKDPRRDLKRQFSAESWNKCQLAAEQAGLIWANANTEAEESYQRFPFDGRRWNEFIASGPAYLKLRIAGLRAARILLRALADAYHDTAASREVVIAAIEFDIEEQAGFYKLSESDCDDLRDEFVSAAQSREDINRAVIRSKWLDAQYAERDWTADTDLASESRLTYNSIHYSYRAGKNTSRTLYIREQIAKALGCALSDVPE